MASDGANPGPTKVNLTGTAAKLDDVSYVVGAHWKQRVLVRNTATGGHLFLDKQWNRMTKKWEYSEMNIGGEACHGPGGAHVASRKKTDIYTFSDKPKAEQTRACMRKTGSMPNATAISPGCSSSTSNRRRPASTTPARAR